MSLGTVNVEIDPAGQPEFEITYPAAWDFIQWNQKLQELAESADVVCFGSLAQRSQEHRARPVGRQTENDDTGIILRRLNADVGEAPVSGDDAQGIRFGIARDIRIIRMSQSEIRNLRFPQLFRLERPARQGRYLGPISALFG